MASEQMPRREIHVEEHIRVPLADKGRGERESDKKEKEKEFLSDRARSGNIVKDKEAEEGRRERGSVGDTVGKLEMKAIEDKKDSRLKAEQEGRTREVVGREWKQEEKERSMPRGKVEAEKATTVDKTREDAKAREKASQIKVGGGEKQGRGREAKGEANVQPSFEEISHNRAEAQQKVKERNERANQAASEAPNSAVQTAKEKHMKANEKATQAKNVTREKGQQGYLSAKDMKEQGRREEQGRGREEKEGNKQPSLEEISKYRAEAQQKAMNEIASAQERYEREKQASSEAQKFATQKEKNIQAKEKPEAQLKEVTREKGQQGHLSPQDKGQHGYDAAKGTVGDVIKSAGDTIGEKAAQAKEVTVETGKSAAEVAGDLKDRASVAGWSAAHYSAEMTVEGTKAVTNVVKGVAEYAGQKASEFAGKSVDTAKGLAASAGENAKEYTARKKGEAERDLEAKREAQNQEFKERPSAKTTVESFQRGQGLEEQDQGGKILHHQSGQVQGQVGKGSNVFATSENTAGKTFQETQGLQGKASEAMASIGETLGSVAQTVKKPLNKATEGGREVLGAVGETVVEIGENMMKPAQKVQQHGDQGKGGGMLNAIGETIAEIAETTKVMVAGEGETVSRDRIGSEATISHEYDSGKQGNLKHDYRPTAFQNAHTKGHFVESADTDFVIQYCLTGFVAVCDNLTMVECRGVYVTLIMKYKWL
ncbi:hypothetical protein RJT34_31322 [Clitoria ternatea]|uniref:Seed biotin-containing protein SBP65 n=1 Tax=Clitoria ternatea TaxID=43366 RepID=A0AAN9EV77_CLITE